MGWEKVKSYSFMYSYLKLPTLSHNVLHFYALHIWKFNKDSRI
jgi:hypothetical protein